MICEHCKERPASVIVKKGSMGEATEYHLCKYCAFQSEAFQMQSNEEAMSIQQFLAHWLGGGELFQAPQQQQLTPEKLACPECQLTFQKFLEIGKFGCATCYETFREHLPRVLGKLHSGQTTHIGKLPMTVNELFTIKRKIEEVRLKMQEAVAEERFEEAAVLRDEAKRLQRLLDDGGEPSNVD